MTLIPWYYFQAVHSWQALRNAVHWHVGSLGSGKFWGVSRADNTCRRVIRITFELHVKQPKLLMWHWCQIYGLRTNKKLTNPSLLPTPMLEVSTTDTPFLQDLLFMIWCCVVMSSLDVAILFPRIFVSLSAEVCTWWYKSEWVSLFFFHYSVALFLTPISQSLVVLCKMPATRKSKAKAKRSYVSSVIWCVAVLLLTYPSISPSVPESSVHSSEVEDGSRFFSYFLVSVMFCWLLLAGIGNARPPNPTIWDLNRLYAFFFFVLKSYFLI